MAKSCPVARRLFVVMVTVLLAGGMTAPVAGAVQAEAEEAQGPPPRALDRARNGEAAINAVGNRLPEVAVAHGMTPDELRHAFRTDETLYVDPTLRLYFIEPPADSFQEPASTEEPPVISEAPPFPFEDTFELHSRPGAERVIFLDFDGHTVTGTAWNNDSSLGTGTTVTATPFDKDGNPSTFSDVEREAVQGVWQRVAEDYAPFNVNVTTQDPGDAAIKRATSTDAYYGTRLVIDGGTPPMSCGCGGLAYVGVFNLTGSNHSYYQPAFVFQYNLGGVNASAKVIAEAASHEVGHNLNLVHDGAGTTAYYEGHGAWAPIMGVGYFRPLSQWSAGEYTNATSTQDDMAVMAGTGIPLMADDHGDTNGSATPLGGVPVSSGLGLISTRTDVDVFSFVADGSFTTIGTSPAPVSPNLDVSLELYNDSGILVAAADPLSAYGTRDATTGLDASIAQAMPPGTYYVHVRGIGAGDLATGYSDYASLGRYDITVTREPAEVKVPPAADFDGDGDGDRSVFRSGAWYAEGQPTAYLGMSGDIPVPADYNGDGKTERAVFRNGAWYVQGQPTVFLGSAGDVPVPGDYDGDGSAERAIYRPSVGGWYVEGQPAVFHGGQPNDVLVPGDYDANGSTDRAIWRPGVGGWYVQGQPTAFLGMRGDVPVPGDYDADGSTDRAIWRPAVGGWYVQGQPTAFLGMRGDIPLPLPQAIYRAFF